MKKSKKVLLVYPGKIGSTFPEMPLAYLYLSCVLRENGFIPEVIDMRLEEYNSVDPREYLFIGITSVTGPVIKFGLNFAKFAKERCPDITIVWGGIHPSLLPEQTLENKYVDIVVVGEGEETVKELSLALYEGGSLSDIKGIAYKSEGKAHLNPVREFIDLNSITKELPYELFLNKKYALDYFPVHTSRGCPYRCGFCYNLAFNQRKWRAKRAELVIDEIDYVVKKFGARHLSFTWEDEFFIDKNRVEEICRGMLERGIKVKWDAFCRFNHFYKFEDEFIKLLENAGCSTLSFGGESGSQRMLDEVIQKDVKVEQIITTTEKLAKTNIRQVVSFMSGLPGETDEDMNQTYRLMDKLCQINPNIYLNGIFLYTPYPGTTLFNLVRKEFNYSMPASLEEWANFGIYRNVGATWQSKVYINKFKTISILTRFPFYQKKFSFKDVGSVIGGGRFSKFPYNVVYYIYSLLARWRWKKRFFRFPLEWWFLEKAMEKVRGFI
ncbi:MAG: B12-binding domain-containing radical SAM protein [Candidatus Omnitrophica bacterium]|nr:B12-binding domain-containing radical SAM protein [Candidatus Omnitrophota bacterium]